MLIFDSEQHPAIMAWGFGSHGSWDGEELFGCLPPCGGHLSAGVGRCSLGTLGLRSFTFYWKRGVEFYVFLDKTCAVCSFISVHLWCFTVFFAWPLLICKTCLILFLQVVWHSWSSVFGYELLPVSSCWPWRHDLRQATSRLAQSRCHRSTSPGRWKWRRSWRLTNLGETCRIVGSGILATLQDFKTLINPCVGPSAWDKGHCRVKLFNT